MNTLAVDRREPDFEQDGSGDDQPLPRRPRRQFFNRRSAALLALLTCAAGFYAGVRVEKGQLASTPSTFTLGGATGAAGASRTGARGGAAGATGSATGARTGATSGAGSGAGSFASRFGGGASGAGASFGTVSTVNGKTLVVTEASGNTVKVQLSPSTKITKNQSVSRSAIRPGDTVVIAGAPNSTGTVVAATVSDSGSGSALGALAGGLGAGGASAGGASTGGAGAAGAGASGSGSGSGRGSNSAVGSLFSGGGGAG
jgi:hypothetical protein